MVTNKKLKLSLLLFTIVFTAVFTGCLLGDDIYTIRERVRENDVLPVITIEEHPASLNALEGRISGSLSVTANVTREAELSYQWFSNTTNSSVGGTAIDGATSPSFEIPTTLTNGQYFFFVEVNARVTARHRAAPVRSAVGVIWVSPPGSILITTHPQPQTTVVQGNISGSLTVDAIASGRTSFQWFSNTENCNENGTKIEGETGTSFEIPQTLTVGTYYYFAEVSAVGVAVPLRSTVAVVIVDEPVVMRVSASNGGHTVAIMTDGELWAWGANWFGQLGDGTTIDRHSPERIGTTSNWASVSVGWNHTMAITTNGELWTWGRNREGQLGDGTTIDRHSPVRIGTASNWVSVSAGWAHTVAITASGELWAWGQNNLGQLGDGTTINRHSPVRIGTTSNWVSVSAGEIHTVAITASGELWAWGRNGNGRLGDGTTIGRHSPVRIGTASNWASVSAGWEHTVAITENGELWAWGWNNWGQLGDGTTTNHHSPVKIGTASNWASVSAGRAHTVAITTSGELWAWGGNWHGQLGDGTTIDRHSPERIGTTSNWVSVSAGWGNDWDYTVAITANGELWTWGRNQFGQLGDGTTVERHSPVRIRITP